MSLLSSVVAARATKMFTEGDGAPRTSRESRGRHRMKEPTLWLVKIAREVVAPSSFNIIQNVCERAGAP